MEIKQTHLICLLYYWSINTDCHNILNFATNANTYIHTDMFKNHIFNRIMHTVVCDRKMLFIYAVWEFFCGFQKSYNKYCVYINTIYITYKQLCEHKFMISYFENNIFY